MKKIVAIILFSIISCCPGLCQLDLKTPLKIGDRVPEYQFHHILNYKSKTANISDFNGKLLILDFWATWCPPCIASMPAMHELQQKFGNKIQIILVNDNEDKAKVDLFIKRRSAIKKSRITLPLAYSDAVLSKSLFSHQEIPAFFWIDGTGTLRQKTSKIEVNEKNIEALLKGKAIAAPDTRRIPMPSELRNDTNLVWKSQLLKDTLEGTGPFLRLMKNKDGFSAIVAFRSSVIDLFRFAYGLLYTSPSIYVELIPINRTVLESTNDSIIYGKHMKNYERSGNLFVYQLVAPAFTSPGKMLDVMRADLEKWFGLTAINETRMIEYLSLTSSDTTLLAYQSGKMVWKINDAEFELNKITLDEVLSGQTLAIPFERNFLPPHYLIVNDTGFKGKVGHISVVTDVRDYKALDRSLSKYGLRLNLIKGKKEVLTIRESKSF